MDSIQSDRRVFFIGLGVMGFPMAGHLADKGYQVTVFNRTTEKSERWLQTHTGKYVRKLKDGSQADVIISCVGNDHDLRSVYLGEDGLINNLSKGSLIIDHTTASAVIARELHQTATEQGVGFVDGPVSGGQQGAENGALTVMCGGQKEDFERALPLLNCYAKAVKLLGDPGSGQLTKMVNQIAIAGLVQGLSEAMHFAEQAGLNGRKVVEAISKGAAQSWQMENRHETMLDGHYEHGFAVNWMRKDLAICLEEARLNGARLPVTALVDQFYSDVQAMGGERWDTSSLLERLRKVSDRHN